MIFLTYLYDSLKKRVITVFMDGLFMQDVNSIMAISINVKVYCMHELHVTFYTAKRLHKIYNVLEQVIKC